MSKIVHSSNDPLDLSDLEQIARDAAKLNSELPSANEEESNSAFYDIAAIAALVDDELELGRIFGLNIDTTNGNSLADALRVFREKTGLTDIVPADGLEAYAETILSDVYGLYLDPVGHSWVTPSSVDLDEVAKSFKLIEFDNHDYYVRNF